MNLLYANCISIKLLKKLALHNIKMSDKIYANNLKFQFFFIGILNSKKSHHNVKERPQRKEKLCDVTIIAFFFCVLSNRSCFFIYLDSTSALLNFSVSHGFTLSLFFPTISPGSLIQDPNFSYHMFLHDSQIFISSPENLRYKYPKAQWVSPQTLMSQHMYTCTHNLLLLCTSYSGKGHYYPQNCSNQKHWSPLVISPHPLSFSHSLNSINFKLQVSSNVDFLFTLLCLWAGCYLHQILVRLFK